MSDAFDHLGDSARSLQDILSGCRENMTEFFNLYQDWKQVQWHWKQYQWAHAFLVLVNVITPIVVISCTWLGQLITALVIGTLYVGIRLTCERFMCSHVKAISKLAAKWSFMAVGTGLLGTYFFKEKSKSRENTQIYHEFAYEIPAILSFMRGKYREANQWHFLGVLVSSWVMKPILSDWLTNKYIDHYYRGRLNRWAWLRLPLGGYREAAAIKVKTISTTIGLAILAMAYWIRRGRDRESKKGKNKGRGFNYRNTNVKSAQTARGVSKGAVSRQTKKMQLRHIYDDETYDFVEPNTSAWRTVKGSELRQVITDMFNRGDDINELEVSVRGSDIWMQIDVHGNTTTGWDKRKRESTLGKVPLHKSVLDTAWVRVNAQGWAPLIGNFIIIQSHLLEPTGNVLTHKGKDYPFSKAECTELSYGGSDVDNYFFLPKMGVLPGVKSTKFTLGEPLGPRPGLVINADYVSQGSVGGDKHTAPTIDGWCGSVVLQMQDNKYVAVGMHIYGDDGGGANGYQPFTKEMINLMQGNGIAPKRVSFAAAQ